MASRLAVLVLLVFVFAPELTARDIFVSNVEGDDRRDGSSPELLGVSGGPCRSIAHALELAKNGDRIIVAKTAVPYRESITLQAERHSGIPQRPFILLGNGATLDGTNPVPKDVWEPFKGDIYRFRPRLMSHQVLYLEGKPVQRRPAQTRGVGILALGPLEWCLFEGQIYFRVEPGKYPREYNLACSALTVGVTLYDVRHVVVSDFVLQGFQLDGVNAHDGVVDATLVGLTCRGNGRSGISVGGASHVSVRACLVGDNGDAQVRTEGFSRTEIVDCDLIDKTAPALVRSGGLVTLLNGDKDKP